MKKRCIVISKDFNHVTPIMKYWDYYNNPHRKVMSMHFGGDFHQELLVKKGKLRTIGGPLIPGNSIVKTAGVGYQYVDAAKICDIESPLDFPDTVFISERDGWIEDIEDTGAYLSSFDSNMVICIVHIERLRVEAQKGA